MTPAHKVACITKYGDAGKNWKPKTDPRMTNIEEGPLKEMLVWKRVGGSGAAVSEDAYMHVGMRRQILASKISHQDAVDGLGYIMEKEVFGKVFVTS